MSRTRLALIAATPLALAALLGSAMPAHAVLSGNGVQMNAMAPNSMTPNGLEVNGVRHNALSPNALGDNGVHINGVGTHGEAAAGSALEQLEGVVVETVILPPGMER
jgi:hypothetical protein